MAFSEKQKEWFENANHRWNIKTGAVRSGKTYADFYTIPKRIRARIGKPGIAFIFGVSKGTIERNVLEPMRDIWGENLVGGIKSDNTVRLFGETVYCLGCEKVSQVGKIRGTSIKYAYGDEVAEWNPEVFELIKSRLDKPYSCFDGALNPESPTHWLKEFLDSDADIYSQHYRIFDNPFLPKEFVDNLCKEYEGTVYYDRYIEGLWALAEGLIYPMYQDVLIDSIPDTEPSKVEISLDYGTMNAFAAMLWEKHKDKWIATNGYYYSGRDTGVQKTDNEYVEALEAKFDKEITRYRKRAKEAEKIGGLPPEKIKVIIDPSAASFIALLRKRDWCKVVKADNDVLNGIRDTATCMNLKKFAVYKGLKEWQNEAGGYVWDEKAGTEAPLKVNDHCLVGETLVNTKDGAKPISELVGTSGEVWSYNTEKGVAELKLYHDCRLTQEQAEIYEIETEDGRFIRCTGEHPILTDQGYIVAENISRSNRIFTIWHEYIGVVSVRKIGKADVYNMEVEDNHNFAIEGGMIVHNCMDAMRYFVRTEKLAKVKRETKDADISRLARSR